MLKHKIHFDLICFNNRLNESDVEMANKEVVGLTEEVNIVDLWERLNSPSSGTRIQAYLESGRKNGYWMSQSLFALDFDSSITFRQASGKFRGYGLDCAFAYQAFSHNPKQERFIIVFQLEKPVSDRTHRDQIQNDLRVLLSESNKSCEKDVVKIICEGEDLIYTNYSYYLDLEKLLLAARFSSVRNTKSEHLNQALKRLDKKSKLCVKNGSHYTYNIESFRFNTKTEKKLQTVNWNELRNKVKS